MLLFDEDETFSPK